MLVQTKKFVLNAESVDTCSDFVYNALSRKSIENDNLVRLRLKLEAVLMIWLERFPANTECRLFVTRRLGRYVVRIFAAGDSVNPFKLSTEEAIEEELTFFYNLALNASLLSTYKYDGKLNIVEFTVPKKPLGTLGKMSLAMGGGIAIGLLCQFVLPSETALLISQDFVSPAIKAIMGLLGGIASIYVFISVVAAICNMDNVNSFSNVGRKIIFAFGGLNLLAVILSGLIFMGAVTSVEMQDAGFYDLGKMMYRLILRIVPSNLFKPFVEKDAMQLLFLSVFIGQLISILGTKVRELRELINNFNVLILEGMNYVCRSLPIAVFFCMLDLVLCRRISMILHSWQILLPATVVTYLIAFMVCLFAHVKGVVTFREIGTDIKELVLLGGATGTRTSCLTKMYEICSDRLQLNKSLTDMGIPLSSMFMVNQKVSCLLSYVCGMAIFYEVDISVDVFFALLFAVSLLVYTIPPIPMGSMIIVGMILEALEIPGTAVSIIIPIDLVSGFIMTPPVVLATVVTLAIVNQSVEGQP